MKKVKTKTETKDYFTFEEIADLHSKQPPIKFLWGGISEFSMGIIFGPSKSGKTTLCECFAMHLASGRKDFMGIPISVKAKKVLFIGLEENWIMRARRNRSQYEAYSDSEKKLINTNYLYQPINYLRLVSSLEDWKNLESTIKKSKAEVVFIDSITRLNHGSLEKSNDAEKIMQRLRDLCLKLKITLICIHHTPKIGNSILTMDSMKGSVVFAQESDFMIGIRKVNSGERYLKQIEFRYSDYDDEFVYKFEFTEKLNVNCLGKGNEFEMLEPSDGRRSDDHKKHILNKVKKLECKPEKTKKIVSELKRELNLGERQVKKILRQMVTSGLLKQPERGYYLSNDCVGVKNEKVSYEEE